MSGGHFDYKQYSIEVIAEGIDDLIRSNNDDSISEWGDTVGRFYSEETIKELKKAVHYCRLAFIYTQRIDWLVSGDDSEESFHERLKEELEAFSVVPQ